MSDYRMIDAAAPVTDWAEDLILLDEQSALLVASIEAMSEDEVGQPSGLPGWTRGHVLAHLDGNAQGLGRVARWARDGIERPMYISREVRNGDVDLHAGRALDEHALAVAQSARALRADLGMLTEDDRTHTVVLGNGMAVRGGSIARHRIGEVCVHHADLGLPTYTWRSWPDSMAWHMATLVASDFAERGEFPVDAVQWGEDRLIILPMTDVTRVVSGTPQAILAWMLGRSDGEGLTVSGIDAIPAAPTWR